jgi:peptide/nickel transport system permease protein
VAKTPIERTSDLKAGLVLPKKKETMASMTWDRFKRNKLAVTGAIILFLITTAALLAPVLATHDPAKLVLLDKLAAPSAEHYLGTDDLGRDIFSRLLYGARVSLMVGFTAVLGSVVIGTIYGAFSGYYGGRVDNIMMRIVDVVISFPSLFLLITVVTILEPSVFNIIAVLALLSWTGTARLVRGEFLSLKKRDFVDAVRTLGASDIRIIFLHILPNAMAPIIVAASLGMAGMILAESALSFLGLGIQPPQASWGNMLQGAQNFTVMLTAWWFPLFPGLMIFITVLCLNFVGDGLRDALDPRLKD